MSSYHPLGTLLYLFSVLLAMCLNVLPLSSALQFWNLDWVLLVLIFWLLALPYKWGIVSSWMVGLLMDVLTGRLLGQHALIYAIVSYVCLKLYKRVRHFPLIQQEVFIFCCLLLAHTLAFCIEGIQNPSRFQWVFLLPVISGTLIWPFAWFILRNLHFNRRVR
ncbi:MAG: rod shape-determining protein MreD [Methylococcaceae bacterium]